MRMGNDLLMLEVRGLVLGRALVDEEVAVHFSRSILDMIIFAAFGLCEWLCAKCNLGTLGEEVSMVGAESWVVRLLGDYL